MNKKIGIVICNYNKEDYIINCIQSVLSSSFSDFDVFVVDNASTDNSVSYIKEKFGDAVNLLINTENLGGSGGFNRGLREVMKYNYQYIMLMDNDIVADKNAIEELARFLDENPKVGMVGSKVYFMDYPDRIWGYGGNIDFNEYLQKDQYKNCTDSDSIPEITYCDYVAACSLMVRAEAIKKVGLMPEENFIYWDDMEWGYRFNQAGYLVAVYGKSKIWHKAGGRNAENTFIHYYMWRNRLRFFLKILPVEKREHFATTILSEMFRMIYSVNLKKEFNIVQTLMYALDDAVHGVSGKAAEYKILPRPAVENRVQYVLQDSPNVIIKFNNDFEGLGNIIRNIKSFATGCSITIAVTGNDSKEIEKQVTQQFRDCKVQNTYHTEKFEKHLIMCDHIFKITKDQPQDIYIDPWCNIIFNVDDYIYASSFEQSKELFLLCMKNMLMQGQIS